MMRSLLPSRRLCLIGTVAVCIIYLLVTWSSNLRFGGHIVVNKSHSGATYDRVAEANKPSDRISNSKPLDGGVNKPPEVQRRTPAPVPAQPKSTAKTVKTTTLATKPATVFIKKNTTTTGPALWISAAPKNHSVPEWSGENMFPKAPLVIWSNDFHIGPIQDLKHLLQPMGAQFIDKSLSGHCHLTKTCATNLRVINRNNGISLARNLIPMFYESYKNDPEMKSVDAFVCYHPSSMCELFMPFNKSLIVIASTRYEMGRHAPDQWKLWNENLIKIAKDPKNVVAGNNMYDAKYIEYFTGVPAQVLPSFCGYIPESYNPSRPGFLLAPVHHGQFQNIFLNMFRDQLTKLKADVTLTPLRAKYQHYKYSDLTAHQGMVYIPYQVSVMSLFEQYRMNIPMFFPSLNLLTNWQFEYHVMNERTWSQVHGRIPDRSAIPGVQSGIPDPNNERDKDAIRYWIKYADFYTFPHIVLYDSVEDLIHKMQTTDLKDISEKMKIYNAQFKKELAGKWASILKKIYKSSKNHKKI